MVPDGFVSVCPFCPRYRKCPDMPCLQLFESFVPYDLRKADYIDRAEICLHEHQYDEFLNHLACD